MKKPKGKLFALLVIFAALVLVAASGAFTSVQAERTAQVDVASDADAFLALSANTSNNNGVAYASNNAGANDNQLSINLTSSMNGGDGVNPNSVTTADHVFIIQNQGTQPVDVYLEQSDTVDDSVLEFYYNGTTATPSATGSLEGSSNAVTLEAGEQVSAGVKVDTRAYTAGDFTEQVTVHATAN
jgi:hypothetical protein